MKKKLTKEQREEVRFQAKVRASRIGKILRARRKLQKIPINDVVNLSGLCKDTIYAIEKGKIMSLDQLIVFGDALGYVFALKLPDDDTETKNT